MYGIYGDIIEATDRALGSLEETQELLEYPEVQADKAYYLSVLTKYNALKFLQEKKSELISALEDEKTCSALLAEAVGDEDRAIIYGEIATLRARASRISADISVALGCKRVEESAYCRFKLKSASSKLGVALFDLIKEYLTSQGAKVYAEKFVTAKGGYTQEISFEVSGESVVARLSALAGAHKVYLAQGANEELCFAVTPSARVEKVLEKDLKIDLFHSSGAGGQNVNKVETAIRVTHLPTGTVVVCQDERSQLKNKKRALEIIERRLKEAGERAEKERIESDIRAQYSKKNTSISFDAVAVTMSDCRLKAFEKIKFPPSGELFAQYMNGLLAL